MRRRLLTKVLPALAFLAVVVLGIHPRLLELLRVFWLDEASQSLFTLRSEGFWALRSASGPYGIPILDFALRKWFWYPIFGYQELGLRLPSLAYSCATIVVVGYFAHRRLRSHRWGAVAGALLAAAWCGLQATERHYSVEARPYSLVSLLSAAWAGGYLLLDGPCRARARLITSALFLQAHFFAAPLVGGGYLMDAFLIGRRGATRLLAEAVVLFALTAAINWPALRTLFGPLAASYLAYGPPDHSLAEKLTGAAGLYWHTLRDLELPILPIFVWIPLALAGFRDPAKRLAFLLLVVLPSTLLVIRLQSNHFHTGYTTPLFGLGMATLVLALETLLEKTPPRLAALPVAVSAGFFALTAGALAQLPGRWSLPPENFSSQSRMFENFKLWNRPAMVIARPNEGVLVPLLYWNLLGARASSPLALEAEIRLDEFLRRHPDALIFLYQVHSPCPKQGSDEERARAGIYRLDLGRACAWALTRPGNRRAVEAAAAGEGFIMDSGASSSPLRP